MFKNMVTNVDEQDDNFVGLKFFDGKPLVIFLAVMNYQMMKILFATILFV